MPKVALLDANVLYPAPLRDVLLQLASMGAYQARWSADIHREWIDALLEKEPGRQRKKLERTRDLMNQHVHDALVIGYEDRIATLCLSDPDDRHVLAAAIKGSCHLIVTKNLKDFPEKTLEQHGLEAWHQDTFLLELLRADTATFLRGLGIIRARLTDPPYTPDQYLDTLNQQDLGQTVAMLRPNKHLI